ncbi:MAG: polysaccharide pyruvyl transferase family protein [Komarekiella atlantica HA4396-MV6]|jgi:colanic acid/amylovoran biosynthesis protein|nr:polysaccharide pyruvyl transferase family protein [Komarekiella atlantica HA4396-MV6]
MKALITGVTGLRNRGVEALLTTTVDQLFKRHPNLTIDILTETPDYDQKRLQQDNVKLLNMATKHKDLMQKLRAKGSKFNKSLAPEYSLFKEASIVIASGGDLFTSDYPGALGFHLRPLELALHAEIPVVFLGQSIAFKTNNDAQQWLGVARRSKLITVREEFSYKYLTKDLGLSPNLVKHTADVAFLLEPPPPDQVSNLLKSYGVTPDRPVVAIAPSQGITRFSKCDEEQHLKSWFQVINMILNEFDAQVLLIPHAQSTNLGNDDRFIATNLHKSLDFHPRVHLAGADHSASEFKGLISSCDLLIAERMHAAIAGLSSNICTVVVGYSVKAEGIMTDLLGNESVNNGLLISIEQFIDSDSACATIRTAWHRRQEVSEQLKEALPRVRQDAVNNFDMIVEILK